MLTVAEPPRETPIIAEADLVVCGGGQGGLPAAGTATALAVHDRVVPRDAYVDEPRYLLRTDEALV